MPAIQATLPKLNHDPRHHTHAAQEEKSRQETLQAWEAYQASGLHVTSDEVLAWLQTWGTDSETTAPTCHK